MCGIAGLIGFPDSRNLSLGIELLSHRGPDASSIWEENCSSVNLAFAHTRLSIVDLTSSANQPFSSKDRNYTIVFNGEIYNFEKIKKILVQSGHSFFTKSDTEVLLNAYIEYGNECVKHFDGMFAFAIFDKTKQKVFVARDHFGVKPLYFHLKNRQFSFASEIMALAAISDIVLEADTNIFPEFLFNGFVYEPATGYKDISKLEAGHYLEIFLPELKIKTHKYYDPITNPSNELAKTNIENCIKESMNLQGIADVPVGLFFSGGIDSSILAAYASTPVQGIFIDYKNCDSPDSDSVFVNAIADHLKLPLVVIEDIKSEESAEDILNQFRTVAMGVEEPISDFTYIATKEICKVAKDNGYKAMISGMGGDELYAGYPRYLLAKNFRFVKYFSGLISLITKLPFRSQSFEKKVDRLIRFSTERNFVKAYTYLVGYFSDKEVNGLLRDPTSTELFWKQFLNRFSEISSLSYLKQAMYLDLKGFLPHNLTVTDRASMSQGVEVRVPLITTNQAEMLFNTQDKDLIAWGTTKKILKKLLVGNIPRNTINRTKQGFNPPLDNRINKIGMFLIKKHFKSEIFEKSFNGEVALKIVDDHFEGRANNTYKIWQLLFLCFWLESITNKNELLKKLRSD